MGITKFEPSKTAYWQKLPAVVMLDPSIATRNSGDEIIADACRTELFSLFPKHFLSTIPTHEQLATRSYRLIHQSEHAILGGSNILTPDLFRDRGWRYSLKDTYFVHDIISLATGWRSYEAKGTRLGRMMLRRALSASAIHSVRDEYTKTKLAELGIRNVVNTGCVTMWRLDVGLLATLPRRRASKVVTTLNSAHPTVRDRELTDLLLKKYDQVFVWPQGIDDLPYVQEVLGDRGVILGQSLAAYDALLDAEHDLDFVGNRLHGGIRAMQKGHRALIFSVDNRATEITRDTGLPAIARSADLEQLAQVIDEPPVIDIKLPSDAIETWRGQFR